MLDLECHMCGAAAELLFCFCLYSKSLFRFRNAFNAWVPISRNSSRLGARMSSMERSV